MVHLDEVGVGAAGDPATVLVAREDGAAQGGGTACRARPTWPPGSPEAGHRCAVAQPRPTNVLRSRPRADAILPHLRGCRWNLKQPTFANRLAFGSIAALGTEYRARARRVLRRHCERRAGCAPSIGSLSWKRTALKRGARRLGDNACGARRAAVGASGSSQRVGSSQCLPIGIPQEQ